MTADTLSDSANARLAGARMARSRRRWRALAFIALAVALLAVLGRFALSNMGPDDEIARININGTIATDPARLAVFKKLGDDPHVKAVIMAINSPGGTTAGGEELYQALAVLRAKKPVVAVIGELGASAAYMTAIATDRIYARRLSIVGSIGVLFETYNASKLLDTIGVGMEKVASGPLKAEPGLDKPMSPQVRASLAAVVADSFNWFVDIVAKRRDLPRPDVLALADGRILSGHMALEDKLIDAIGGEAEAIDWLQSEKHLAKNLPVVTAYPPPSHGWADQIGNLFGGAARGALGMGVGSPIALDGLVSLWQVGK